MIREKSQLILTLVSLTLLTINIFLLVQNIQLKNAIDQSKQFVTEEGYKFTNLQTRDLNETEEIFNFADGEKNTLLLVFNSSCAYCTQEYAYWKELIKKTNNSRWKILSITSESDYDKLKKHIGEYRLEDLNIHSVSSEDIANARLLFTPMTLAINSEGEVKKVWPGLWKRGFDLPD